MELEEETWGIEDVEQEIEGLVSSGPVMRRADPHAADSSICARYKTVGLVALPLLVFSVMVFVHGGSQKPASFSPAIISYQCPSAPLKDLSNFNTKIFAEDYIDDGQQPDLVDNNATFFLDNFRDHIFDGWGETYNKFKKNHRPVKKEFYVPYVKNGDHIYESAAGIGLNLYLTLEILYEEAGITNLTVYGNEFVQPSVEKGNIMLDILFNHDEGSPMQANHMGALCQGDSSDLSNVPSDAFDLVFTGYISPLWDPLEFGLGFDDNYDMMDKLCKSDKGGDWKAQKLLAVAKKHQEEWHAKWLEEMIRIAKPGAPVIVEQAGLPYCQKPDDWGGVVQEFWSEGIDKYGWDVEAPSIAFSKATIGSRYNVFMRKNKKAI